MSDALQLTEQELDEQERRGLDRLLNDLDPWRCRPWRSGTPEDIEATPMALADEDIDAAGDELATRERADRWEIE